ncbi:MAG: DUF4442 domain-containing protein [Bacteroidetes bacterium]|nr:DUF4442 domain-containing protein [Bacteroidota bacterium]
MVKKFSSFILHPFRFRLYMLKNLPAALFSGVNVEYLDNEKCIVSIPFKWFTRNPFNSTYFASLSMAAEMSTGILAMAGNYDKKPRVSMLVTRIEGRYFKKATNKTTFTCEDGKSLASTINYCISNDTSANYSARSRGIDKNGDIIAEFVIEWSFKPRIKNSV